MRRIHLITSSENESMFKDFIVSKSVDKKRIAVHIFGGAFDQINFEELEYKETDNKGMIQVINSREWCERKKEKKVIDND